MPHRDEVIGLDIETAANPEALAVVLENPPEFTAPSNWKDPDKIEKKIAEEREKWMRETVEKAALDRFLLRVASVGIGYPDGTSDAFAISSEDGDEAERWLMESVADVATNREVLVTFNGIRFDGPILRHRMMKYGVILPVSLVRFPRYRYEPFLDLRAVLTDWDPRERGTFQDFCQEFGVECSPPTDPRQIQTWFDEGDVDQLTDKSKADAEELMALYDRLEDLGLFMT